MVNLFTNQEPLKMGVVNVKILNVDDYDLIGEVMNESSNKLLYQGFAGTCFC